MLTYFTVLLIKERVSKLKYPMLPLYLKMQCLINGKDQMQKKLLNERGTTPRNQICLYQLKSLCNLICTFMS